jgi:predicted GNAT family acetyltransferase
MTVVHEPGRFVARVEGLEAYVTYVVDDDVIDVQHTYTPPALRGRDIAARLTEAVVAYAQAQGLRILPSCPYTRAWLARRPDLRALVADG